ncbi:hypothetical protein JG687_00010450 [Phytophthora cactorum]|uniref:Uncharacterized protein n=1 Tax=Phytophthora cactorum TaxID=29920 RepID=A0A8T1U766_9STRA|nr:hypothetical protein JG687_00010450 [Phytophthora cactorum]
MVFGNEYEDEGDERNFGRAEERDDGEQPMSVPAAVERLERVARARVSRDPLSVVEQAPVSDEGAAEPQGVATTGINLESDVWCELFVDEAKETEEEEKGRSATGVTVKTEVREEPEVKREVVKVAVVGDVKEVVRSVEAVEEVGAVCEVSRTVGEAPVEDEKEVFWDAVETKVNMINKHKGKDEGVSFPRIRFAPRLFAAPPLKFALKKLEVVITDWRPSEDAGVDVSDSVFASWGKRRDSPKKVTGLDEATLERVMCEDVVLPLQEEDVVATASEVLPRPAFGRKAIQKEKVRGVAHEAVYRMLKEAAMSQGGTDGAVVPRSSDVECVGVPPLRDKASSGLFSNTGSKVTLLKTL